MKRWIVMVLAGALLLPLVASSATFKIATLAPDGTAWMKQLRDAADRITDQTDGRVKFKFYPGGVMGDAATVRRKMRVGQLHGGAFTGGELAEVDPDFFLHSLPFLFRDLDEVQAVRKQLDPRLKQGLRTTGLELLGIAGGGFVYLMSDKELRSDDDLSSARVWVPDNDPLSEMALRESGISPIPLPLSDVYTGLQTGVIDTAMNTEVGAIAFQWHTKIKHVVDLPVAFVVGTLALDRRAFQKMSELDQEVVTEVFETTFEALEETNRRDNLGAREALINQGIKFTELTDAEASVWRQVGDRTLADLRSNNRFELTQLDFLLQLLEQHRSAATPISATEQ